MGVIAFVDVDKVNGAQASADVGDHVGVAHGSVLLHRLTTVDANRGQVRITGCDWKLLALACRWSLR